MRFGGSVAVIVLAALVAAAGCGGAAKPSAAPSPAGYPGSPSSTDVNHTPSGVQPMPSTRPEEHPGAALALRDFELGERELQTAAGDCATACRALASMERATSQLCSIAELPDDRRRCDDARRRLLAARDRVRGTCSACAGGPSLDREAPVPTVTPRE